MFDLPPPPSYNVVQWAHVVQEERDKTPLTPHELTDAEMLALIELESQGDPAAHRAGSQYEGLLQVGKRAIEEAHRKSLRIEWAEDLASVVTHPRTQQPTQRKLRGDGRLSVRVWLTLYWAYKGRHEHDTTLKGVFWKGGPGTLSGYKRRYVSSRRRADRWLASLGSRGIPNGLKYVQKFERLVAKWQDHVNHLNGRYQVCSPQLMNAYEFTVYTPNPGPMTVDPRLTV